MPIKSKLEPLDSEYSYKEIKEALLKDDIDNILNRYDYLKNIEGIPDPEAKRAITAEFGTDLEVNQNDWKPPLDVGNGMVPDLTMKVFDTGYPPVPPLPVFANTSPFGNDGFDHKNPDPQGYAGGRDVENLSQYKTNAPENLVTKSKPYPYEDQSKENYVNNPFDPPSNPSMHGEHGFNVEKSIPEWKYPIEDDQGGVEELIVDRDKKTGQWVKHGTTKGDLITDHSLAPILDRARKDYLQRQWDGTIEEPYMVTHEPKHEDDPHAVVEALDPYDENDIYAPIWAKYHLGPAHRDMDICDKFKGKVYDLTEMDRPVPPSEGLGYTTTHPNCQCWWQPIKEPSKTTMATKKQRKDFGKIRAHITRKANKGKLHTVKPDGTLSNRTRSSNPMRETIEEIREQFQWLTDKYLDRIQSVDVPGKMFLIRASNEAITDHRNEGEPLRRWLSPDELHGMARTAIGKGMDVNHHPEYTTNAQVLDSEYDRNRHEIQMIINEQDPQILDAINKQIITAVSINGGQPRDEKIECPDCDNGNCECFIVPEGVVLGEQDNIALTWVVTDPKGFNYHGMFIPPATPGVKTTAIEPL